MLFLLYELEKRCNFVTSSYIVSAIRNENYVFLFVASHTSYLRLPAPPIWAWLASLVSPSPLHKSHAEPHILFPIQPPCAHAPVQLYLLT